jgi:hypothetical protein
MGEVIDIRDQKKWSETTLARKSLAWSKRMRAERANDGLFDFSAAIKKEEEIIRSFFISIGTAA